MSENKKPKRKKRYYTTNEELAEEIRKSKEQGRLTEKAGGIVLKIVQGLQSKYKYESQKFKEDIGYRAIVIILENWHKADPDKPGGNLFSWFTTVAHNALKAAMNEHRRRSHADYSYSTLFDESV